MNIVVTGASRGLGKAIAEKFAVDQSEHVLLLTAQNKELLEKTQGELERQSPGTKILVWAGDLSKKEVRKKFAEWVLQQVQGVDILVNNAGIFIPGNVHDEKEGLLEEIMEMNLYGPYHLTRLLLPSMMAKKSGHIFNMCSIASLKAYSGGGAYSISKFALAGFSKNLREEMKPFGIKVTAVYPGATYTDSWKSSGIDPQRIMESNDIADLVYTAAQLSPQACVEDIIVRPQLGDL